MYPSGISRLRWLFFKIVHIPQIRLLSCSLFIKKYFHPSLVLPGVRSMYAGSWLKLFELQLYRITRDSWGWRVGILTYSVHKRPPLLVDYRFFTLCNFIPHKKKYQKHKSETKKKKKTARVKKFKSVKLKFFNSLLIIKTDSFSSNSLFSFFSSFFWRTMEI